MIELGNCPHCGLKMQMKTIPKPYVHGWVGCPFCKIYKQWKHDPNDAIRIMNRRVDAL